MAEEIKEKPEGMDKRKEGYINILNKKIKKN